MLDFSNLNYAAILVCWFIAMLVGSLWYSPIGFQKRWSKLSGVDMSKMSKNEANRAIGFVTAASLVQSFSLAVALHTMQIRGATKGFEAGILLWFGLTAVTTIGNTLYARLSLRFWWLNAGFFLVVMAPSSVILSVWR